MILHFQICAGRRLIPPQRSEPDIVTAQAGKQWFHFAQMTAAIRRGLIEDSELRFLLRDTLARCQVNEVQMQPLSYLIAIRIRFREVISSVEE